MVPFTGAVMPIDRLLRNRGVGPEDIKRLGLAFNLALKGLQLIDRSDPICEIVANKVIEIGLDGVRNPNEIAELTIKQLGS